MCFPNNNTASNSQNGYINRWQNICIWHSAIYSHLQLLYLCWHSQSIIVQIDPEPDDIPELEDDSNGTSLDPPTLLQQLLPRPQQVQQAIPVPQELQEVIQKVASQKKIVGFRAKDIEQANALKLHLEWQDRLAQLEHKAKSSWLAELEEKNRLLEYCYRTTSSSSNSSNYDNPSGSLAPTVAKAKGKPKRNIKQVTNALSFSFSDSRLTRSSFKKKEATGWPPISW